MTSIFSRAAWLRRLRQSYEAAARRPSRFKRQWRKVEARSHWPRRLAYGAATLYAGEAVTGESATHRRQRK